MGKRSIGGQQWSPGGNGRGGAVPGLSDMMGRIGNPSTPQPFNPGLPGRAPVARHSNAPTSMDNLRGIQQRMAQFNPPRQQPMPQGFSPPHIDPTAMPDMRQPVQMAPQQAQPFSPGLPSWAPAYQQSMPPQYQQQPQPMPGVMGAPSMFQQQPQPMPPVMSQQDTRRLAQEANMGLSPHSIAQMTTIASPVSPGVMSMGAGTPGATNEEELRSQNVGWRMPWQ